MLKNKFGMTTRVLLIVLSVLMAVSLAACKKDDGISSDDMNSAIQSAIDAANKAQEEQNKALQSSIAAKEEAEAAQKAAEASSIAAQIKAQEDALKKAQEEADAAKKAAEAASKAAADAAAKAKAEAEQAAKDAAAKAASEAAKKAEESMKALESALKAQEEALKKAQEEAEAAKKAAEEASKRAEEAMSKAEETTVAPETTVVPTTKPAETTVAPETTAPIVMEDKTDVLTAYSKLKTEYTYTKQNMYNAAEYAELVLLFDHASVELNNAATLDAATSIYNTLVVDVAAVRNVENAAAEVAALVNALGDIETEVFTTQATKIDEAQKAYAALVAEYATYLKADKDGKATADSDKAATKLGINVADLDKAEAKKDVLVAYIESALYEDMDVLYNDVCEGKVSRFDAEDADEATKQIIADAHYKYLVLAVVNGGDFGKGLPIAWEWLVDEETGEVVKIGGVKQINEDKPTDWFTTDELLEVFILPTLDLEFADYISNKDTGLIKKFENGMTALLSVEYYAGVKDDLDLDDIVDALADELEALSYVDDYKGNATMADAKYDVNMIAVKAYIEAMDAYLDVAKELAIENKKIETEDALEEVQAYIDELNETIADTESASALERLNARVDKYEAQKVSIQTKSDAYIANVEAAALLTFEEMLNEDLNKTGSVYAGIWTDITKLVPDNADAIETFLNKILENTIVANFADEVSDEIVDPNEAVLVKLIDLAIADLETFRARVSPFEGEYGNANGEWGDIYDLLKGDKIEYITDSDVYPNTALFEEAVEILNAAIAEIEAITTEGLSIKKIAVVNDDSKPYYFKDVNAYNYAVETLEYAVEPGYDLSKILGDDATVSLYDIAVTDYPIEYAFSPAEQAAEAVLTAWINAYNKANAKIVAIPEAAAYAKQMKLEITNPDALERIDGTTNKTEYDAILSGTNGTLKSEVQKVANVSLTAIDNAVTNYKSNLNIELKNFFVREVKWSKAYKKVNSADTAKTFVGFVTINVNKLDPADETNYGDYANTYNPEGYQTAIDTAITTFENRFFVDGSNGAKAKSNVVELWNEKLATVQAITDAIATYKNKYDALGDDFYKVTAATAVNGTYKYGEIGDKVAASAQPEYVAKYEKALDDLLAQAIIDIMGVELGDSKTTIKNGVDSAVTVKYTPAGTTNESSIKFDGKDGSKIDYNLDKAKAAVQAWEDALLGTANYKVHPNNESDAAKVYDQGNSKIFKEYNSIVLGNTYGYVKK